MSKPYYTPEEKAERNREANRKQSRKKSREGQDIGELPPDQPRLMTDEERAEWERQQAEVANAKQK